MTRLDSSLLNRFDKATEHEWLETNGIGGYSSSSILGTNTRKYHGLLIAATQPPVGRQVLVSKMEEKIYAGSKTYELSANKYHGTVHPHGYIYLKEFQKDIFPEFTYQCNGIRLKKTIVAIHGENTVIIKYKILQANTEFTLELTPLMAGRTHHSLTHAYDSVNSGAWFHENVLRNRMNQDIPEVFISIPPGHYNHDPKWYYGFEYTAEQQRGEGAHEDLFSPGHLYIKLNEGDEFGVILSTQNPEFRDPLALIEKEKKRRKALIKKAGFRTSFLQRLTLAGDQFLVEGKNHKKSIIAGYPWFCDWGRDTMISLPGLCLATGREEEAKRILRSYAQWVNQGMIPNRFPETGQEPEYNTIDATLWYFIAVYKYWLATNDNSFIEEELMPVLAEIIKCHKKGTRYDIHVDEDGLLTGGVPGVQLTWMDAKAGDWVVTPRIGKAVEINALWYNACEIFAKLHAAFGDKKKARELSQEAKKMKKEFVNAFWNPEKKCLYDYIDRDYKDPSVRPNQLFAISLPFSLLTKAKARDILERAKAELFTPRGLRSLSPLDSEYQGRYQGDRISRDNAYHKGTVWGWLIGPYLDTLIKVKGLDGKIEAEKIIENFASHLDEAGVGSISEIFDGDAPFKPRGCFAQAWSISELLRVVKENQLFDKASFIGESIQPIIKKKPKKRINQEAKI